MPISNAAHARAVGWGATLPGRGACMVWACRHQPNVARTDRPCGPPTGPHG